MADQEFQFQVADALTALAIALCEQPGIDSAKLQQDFLGVLVTKSGSVENIGSVASQISSLIGPVS